MKVGEFGWESPGKKGSVWCKIILMRLVMLVGGVAREGEGWGWDDEQV